MFKKWFGRNKKEEKENVENIDTKEISPDETVLENAGEEETDNEKETYIIEDKNSSEETETEKAEETECENAECEIPDAESVECEEETEEPVSESDGEESEVSEACENVDSKDDENVQEGFFERLKKGLAKAKNSITGRIDDVLGTYTKIDDDLLEEIEEILITADVGVNTTMEIIDVLKENIREKSITDPSLVKDELKQIITEMLEEENNSLMDIQTPAIIVVVGVNGVGKTTTIGKLAARYKNSGKKVMLAAADTFRAAATEQLNIWADRTGVDIIKHQEGADPGAVVFDAVKAAKARGAEVLICDTAGRLHNKANLMKELGKIFKIIDREYPEAHRETILVVDATTGQNAVSQAKIFKETADITGIALTKLDGTAKGGVVLAVKKEVGVPIKLIGVGEGINDLQDFNSNEFAKALFE